MDHHEGCEDDCLQLSPLKRHLLCLAEGGELVVPKEQAQRVSQDEGANEGCDNEDYLPAIRAADQIATHCSNNCRNELDPIVSKRSGGIWRVGHEGANHVAHGCTGHANHAPYRGRSIGINEGTDDEEDGNGWEEAEPELPPPAVDATLFHADPYGEEVQNDEAEACDEYEAIVTSIGKQDAKPDEHRYHHNLRLARIELIERVAVLDVKHSGGEAESRSAWRPRLCVIHPIYAKLLMNLISQPIVLFKPHHVRLEDGLELIYHLYGLV